jgi:hypothetical protein
MATPFPALHARANEAAAEKAERAKATRDRAVELLDEIETLLVAAARV